MINFQDSHFEAHQTSNYLLSGQVDLAGFSFALTDESGKCYVLKQGNYERAIISYDDWAQELSTLFRKEPLLKKTYKSSTWTFLSNKATLIPDALVQPQQLRTCLQYAADLDDLDEIHYRTWDKEHAVLVFAVPSPPANVILKYQPHTKFTHRQWQLLRLADKLPESKRILVHFSPSLVDVVLFSDTQLLLCNSYPVNAFTDALYNLTLAMQTQKMRPNDTTVYYMGLLNDEEYNLLARYYKNIQAVNSPDLRLLIGEKAATSYQSLVTLPQCE